MSLIFKSLPLPSRAIIINFPKIRFIYHYHSILQMRSHITNGSRPHDNKNMALNGNESLKNGHAQSKSQSHLSSFKRSDRLTLYGEKDVWAIFSPLSLQYKSINLGQGFPNFPAPDFVKQSAVDAIHDNFNQYSPSKGLPHLTQVLSDLYSPLFEKKIDSNTEIMISQGANQGILSILQAYTNPEDEVLIIEPCFDIYKYNVQMVNCHLTSVPLRLSVPFDQNIDANTFKLDLKEFESKITSKTKVLIMNTPHNPTGKVFSRKELEDIAQIAIKYNILVISDEVYDKLYYESSHIRIATVKGMWERTITVGSAGKTFGVTGWRVGWLIGPSTLIKSCVMTMSRTVFCVSTPLQEAVARSIEYAREHGYFESTRKAYLARRDKLMSICQELGCPVAIPQGGFFMLVNFDPLLKEDKIKQKIKIGISEEDDTSMETLDYALCKWLTQEIGVTGIPPSAFYNSTETKLDSISWVRFCFAKDENTLEEANKRLLKLLQHK